MKRKAIAWFAALLAVLMFGTFAQADALEDLLAASSLTQEQATEFRALMEQVSPALSQEDIATLLEAYEQSLPSAQQTGTLADGRYSLPSGLSVAVPEDWQVVQTQGVAAITLVGPTAVSGTPNITVTVLEQEQETFETADQAYWDNIYSALLPGFASTSLDSFDYQDVSAHEYVCSYGEEGARVVQYQMYFNRNGKAYAITLTTPDDNETFLQSITSFDSVIASMGFGDTTWAPQNVTAEANG
ncbi:MAG TPA: hypothetical protein IAC36_10085 [Candidatus Aphodomonas merdavium]|nr:hypothetical protein [Candidatus Aphodomonas merdavium]